MSGIEQLRRDVDSLIRILFGDRAGMQAELHRRSAAAATPGAAASSAPPIPITLPEQRAELADLEREQAQIRDRLRSLVGRGDPHDERRVVFVESRIGLLKSHIRVAERGLGLHA
jgi:hypothetical protein